MNTRDFRAALDRTLAVADAAGDRRVVFDLSEQVRETIQQKVYENLVKRGSTFL